jgi:hypothetical protein
MIMHEKGEKNKNIIKNHQNYVYQFFFYKGNVLRDRPKGSAEHNLNTTAVVQMFCTYR